MVLSRTDEKSIRAGMSNLADSFARIDKGEAWLVGAHIAPWEGGSRENHEPKRDRKLLLHRGQIDQLLGKTKAKGLTLVPLRSTSRPAARRSSSSGSAWQAAVRPPPRIPGPRRPAGTSSASWRTPGAALIRARARQRRK